MTRSGLLATLLGVSLALCACAPRLQVNGGPVDASFDMSRGVAAPLEASKVDALVLERLKQVPATDQGYIVETAFTERPLRASAFVPPPGDDGEPDWLIPRQSRVGWAPFARSAYTLVLRLTDPATGREVYRVSVSRRGRPGQGEALAPLLADAAAAEVARFRSAGG